MIKIKIMQTLAIIERAKDKTFSIYTPTLDNVILGSSNSVKEAKSDFMNSLDEMILSYTEFGKVIPEELIGVEFNFKYDVASVFDEYDFINVSKFAAYSGINSSLMRQYKTKKDIYVSESQIKK